LGDDRCGPNRIITADFNKDDNLDLAVTNFRYGYIGVIYGDGEGGFGSFQNYPTGDGANSVASADFNMDGNLDLAVTSHYENFVSILHGNGAGDFPERYDYPIGEWATEIAVVDFNTSPLIETELEIEIIGGFGTHMVIRNIGDECAYNIDWNAEISGGILGRINKSDDGYIGMLPADSEIVVDLPFIIGLGLLDMTVTGSASNVETASWTKKGIILLFFVII